MTDLWLDVRTGLRQHRRAPGVALAAILTLAIGIGATTAVFSFIAAVLSAAQPVDDMDRRVALWSHNRAEAETKRLVSPGDFHAWRERATLIRDSVASRSASFNLSGTTTPVRVSASLVTPGYLEFFRWSPVAGRSMTAEDAAPGASRVVVLSHRFWQTQMGAAPDAVGRTVRLDDEPATIVGILPPLSATDGIFVPLALDRLRSDHVNRTLFVFARLAPGASIEQARAEMESVGRALELEHPDTNRGWAVNTRPLQEEFVGPQARLAFAMLFGTTVAVLLIGCINIASLLLARGLAREGEVAVRMALGAGGWRVARQLLVECAVLSALGAVLGVVIAQWTVALLAGSFAIESPWVAATGLNPRMLMVAAAAGLIATIVAGVMPALQARRTSVLAALHASGRSAAGQSHRRLTRALVGGQVAMAVLLLVVSGLLTRTLVALERLDPGFDTSGLLTGRVALPERMPPDVAVRWFDEALARARALPGVEQAGAASRVPFAGGRFNPNRNLVIEGQPAGQAEAGTFAVDYIVTPGYFEALRLPLREGRMFRASDGAGAPLVAIVSETLARRHWPGGSPLGARLRQGDEPEGVWRTVIGVSADVRNDDADQPPLPYLYVPLAQQPQGSMALVLRTAGDPAGLVDPLRRALAEYDPNQAIWELRTMADVLDADLADTRLLIQLLGTFALIALGLAGLGIWGVVAQLVSQRTREIGVRVALGATTPQIVAMVMRHGLVPVLLGLAGGLAAGVGTARLLRGVLFQVAPGDPVTMAISSALLVLVAIAAVAGPAWRAARLDPIVALRVD